MRLLEGSGFSEKKRKIVRFVCSIGLAPFRVWDRFFLQAGIGRPLTNVAVFLIVSPPNQSGSGWCHGARFV